MIPDLDSEIGVTVYSTDFGGIGGRIRTSPDDFEVAELISERAQKSICEDKGYAVYKLKKRNIDTNHALADIFRRRGIRLKALGLKDASAVTEQFVCSARKGGAAGGLSADRYSLELTGYAARPLSKRDMAGNRFRIKISDCSDGLEEFDGYDRILNFYGYQRFGSKRPSTHLVGRAIVRRDFEGAVDLILSYTSPHDSKENTEIRQKLADRENYSRYLDQVPAGMDTERTVLKEMIRHGDALRAVRAIPLQLRRFYVQAYQSFLFNLSLSAAFAGGEDVFGPQPGDVCFDDGGTIGRHVRGLDQRLALPLVGYSYYKKTRFDHYISKVLAREEASPRDFFIREMQEAGSEGGFRQAAVHCYDHSSCDDVVEFSLSRGSFATMVLREIMRPSDPAGAGF